MTSSSTRFLDHTQRRVTVCTTPLDEWLACCRDLYLTTHTTDKHPHRRWDSNPRSQQVSGRTPSGRWDWRVYIVVHIYIYIYIYIFLQTWSKTCFRLQNESLILVSPPVHNFSSVLQDPRRQSIIIILTLFTECGYLKRIFCVSQTVKVSTINIFSNICTSWYNINNTYKNSYMFRHPCAIFRELL
jgi:hypothetical protein